MKSTLSELTSKLQEIPGTDEELDMRVKRFDDHANAQKQKRVLEERKKDDLEEDLNSLQKGQRDLLARHGRLKGEEEENKRRISEREQSIREMGELFGIKGYNYSPLDERKVVEFVSRLGDVQRKQKMDFEKLQGDLKAQNDEYHRKSRSLENELESHKSQRKRLRDQIEERQSKARSIEDSLEDMQILPASFRALQSDKEEKKGRLQKLKQDLIASNYDGRLAEKAEKSRRMEARREQLSFELQTLSLQADSRAKLEINRKGVKNKASEIERLLEVANIKFKALAGQDVNFRTFQTEVDQLYLDKEQEQADIDAEAAVATTNLQKADSNLSHLKTQLNQKKSELKNLERTLKGGLDHHPSLDDALKEATTELNHRTALAGNMLGTSTIYESLLSVGRRRKICGACNRHLTDQEFVVFEEHMKDSMKKSSPAAIEENKAELVEWQAEMDRLQALRPVQASRDRLKAKDIPLLEEQIKEQEDAHPEISQKAEKIGERLEIIKRQLNDISSLKVQALTVARLQSEIDSAKHDIDDLETSLSSSGSTKTADDVQNELSELSGEIRKNDREKQAINMEVENQTRASRDLENSLHQMELKELDLVNKIRDKDRLEEDIERMKQEMAELSVQSKDLDAKISEAQSPIDALQRAYQQSQNELNTKITHAQRLCEEVNKNSDRLNDMNKNLER
ncbi:hypothetical protein BYT27DRAFT_6885480 [Phlegmacium glaucopus]|nr:hypothetical protein BYT27DRAFT_6885480 [Phlegmacium glaucopus]